MYFHLSICPSIRLFANIKITIKRFPYVVNLACCSRDKVERLTDYYFWMLVKILSNIFVFVADDEAT
jgi:hypothetical protein